MAGITARPLGTQSLARLRHLQTLSACWQAPYGGGHTAPTVPPPHPRTSARPPLRRARPGVHSQPQHNQGWPVASWLSDQGSSHGFSPLSSHWVTHRGWKRPAWHCIESTRGLWPGNWAKSRPPEGPNRPLSSCLSTQQEALVAFNPHPFATGPLTLHLHPPPAQHHQMRWKANTIGNSLVVQCLGCGVFPPGAQGSSASQGSQIL